MGPSSMDKSTTAATCDDKPLPPQSPVASCAEGESQGLCEIYKTEADYYCPATCGTCGIEASGECEDKPLSEGMTCAKGVDMGLCTSMPDEAAHFCPKSCGLCDAEGSADETAADAGPSSMDKSTTATTTTTTAAAATTSA